MKTTNYKLGQDMAHDFQITAKTVCTYGESEYNGKKWPRRRHVHMLADVRLSDGSYPHDGESDLMVRALAVYQAIREAYAYYPDGEVEVCLKIVDQCANI
tara:strand:+ start:1163 stop:1462 length:300 start_codon:yes stop_codon:yes gene_type:complete